MYSNHRTCIFVSHFVGVFIYAGTINRPLRLRTVCDNAADGLLIMLRSPTKLGANIPSGVGADLSRPYPNIIKYAYSRHKIRVSVSPHTHFHIINYVFLHHQIRISTSPHAHFRLPFHGCIRIRGHDKSAPTAANGLR